ncbi:M20/M25/M40 family metallo-hydrolase [Thalassotalea marina]|uniref:Aminopeptidase n=1 Tax=Thalassotalea marina TaxID=1673741 RepID=A0A919BHQ6_9GAMM|nr:M20/M25/M40 family metallo-hydrolase [Thalassotalea marina]GHF92376.1 aminopeptidase [Thalassotalea marina]
MKWLLVYIFCCLNVQAALFNKIDNSKLLGHLKLLASDEFAGRAPQTNGSLLSQQYIISQLTEIGISPLNNNFQQKFFYRHISETKQGTNIIGTHLGRPNKSGNWIILSAHYDHKGKGKFGIYNGADDNASGTSALLSIAASIKERDVPANFVFLFTDAEEQGLKGSKAFVESNPALIKETLININIDMVAGTINTNKLFMLAKGLNKVLSQQEIDALYRVDDLMGQRVYTRFRNTLTGENTAIKWLKASDHSSFNKKKIPVLFFCNGIHKNYHTTNDTFENINPSFFLKNTNIILEHILYLAKVFNKT